VPAAGAPRSGTRVRRLTRYGARAQGLSQDQLAAALPLIDVLRVAECLNSLLNRVRARTPLQRRGGRTP
jgi:hypothetical protein